MNTDFQAFLQQHWSDIDWGDPPEHIRLFAERVDRAAEIWRNVRKGEGLPTKRDFLHAGIREMGFIIGKFDGSDHTDEELERIFVETWEKSGPHTEAYVEMCRKDASFRAKHFGPLFGSHEYRYIAEQTMQWCCNELGPHFPHIEPETSCAYYLSGMYILVQKMEEKLKELGAEDFLGFPSREVVES